MPHSHYNRTLVEKANHYKTILRKEYFNAEALYEDAIIATIGEYGLYILRRAKVIESCGIIHGRKLYAL